jgi:hypothetical protein
LELVDELKEAQEPVGKSERGQLRSLAEQLFAPELSDELGMKTAVQMCSLLGGGEPTRVDWIPPPVPVVANAEIA